MFERRNEALLPRHRFSKRMIAYSGASAALVGASLGIGVVGYHVFGQLTWVDSLLNASMILTGMGPVDRMESTPAKLFSAFYALFSGVIFLTSAAILLSAPLHRFLHAFHIELDEKDKSDAP